MTKTEETERHITAADLLVAAAKNSGFLDELAAWMCLIDKHDHGLVRVLLARELEDMFDDNIAINRRDIEEFLNDTVGPFTAAELAPYLNISTSTSTAA